MDSSTDPTARTVTRPSLTGWVNEMQDVLRAVTTLMEDNDRLQSIAESAQRDQADLREEVSRLRSETQQQRSLAESSQREVEHLRNEVSALQSENDRLKSEQVEAGESAAKLLGEMKDLVNQVAHKFQGPSKTSPFAREPRGPQS